VQLVAMVAADKIQWDNAAGAPKALDPQEAGAFASLAAQVANLTPGKAVTVTGPMSLTASLVTSGAATGFRTVQIQTGSQTLTVNNGMDVLTCTATAPTVLQISPVNGGTKVPLNTQIQAQFSAPMNRSTFSLGDSGTTTIRFWDGITGLEVPATISVDASGTIATITPTVVLAAGRTFYTYWSYANYVQDACGNNLGSVEYYFTTSFGTDTTGPTLTGTSPVNSDTNIALNAPVVLQFDTPVDPITAQAGFYMQTGSNTVTGNFTYSTDDKTVTFTPANPLTASTSYTVSYSALITDTTGTALTNPGSFSFTTGTTSDTTAPQVTFVDPPTNTFGVGVNVTPHLTFNEPVNELTIPAGLTLYYENTNVIIPGNWSLDR
jgi:methionine-rich copper-binding protein CopC